jgi:hypothetical protein
MEPDFAVPCEKAGKTIAKAAMKKIMINPSCGAPLPLFKIVFLWARGPQKHNLNLPFGGEAAEREI